MKIWISPYEENRRELPPTGKQNTNEHIGFLIKIQSSEFRAGYADCRPWPIFNDASVTQHIQLLKDRKLNTLLKRSIFFAHIDGVAREAQQSLWPLDVSLRSHYTLLDIEHVKKDELLQSVRQQGFRTLKLKVGRDLPKEIPLCLRLAEKNWFHLRLDFNGLEVEPFLKNMSSLFLSQVELIEDPGVFDGARWKQLETTYGVKTALDQALSANSTANSNMRSRITKIIKPARENRLARKQDVITNSLDHPVGQAFAALQAQHSVERLGRQTRDYGLQSSHLFKPSPYFDQMSTDTAFFRPIPGTGIGFDDLLEREPWTAI